MEVLEAIKRRRSIRRFEDRPVPEECIREILEAARLAPSASNLQTWKFKVVTDPEIRKSLREAAFDQKFVERAPVVIVACIDFTAFGERSRRTLELLRSGAIRPSLEMLLRYLRGEKGAEQEERNLISACINVSIAVQNMVLAATSLGLGTCWVRAFDPQRVAEILELPPECPPLILLPLGYPREDPEPRSRKSLSDILL
ncbi:nitroreductase family protein [Candidatus Solincola tengchongensis]|uniref:nitroreductase family protein n=1 Tax=Candidatus Solincola tengchongensis TaxID=2900693 RepID=UPI00257E0F0C|nr:nitroreductase family protein [Candidatus Solincola tengchongensis]